MSLTVKEMQKPVCLKDFEAHFNQSLGRNECDYFSRGATQEQTLRDNVEAFMRYVATHTRTQTSLCVGDVKTSSCGI